MSLHCGGCGNACAADELCIDQNCVAWQVGLGCNMCPCPGSCVNDLSQCCLYPGAPGIVACVDAGMCP